MGKVKEIHFAVNHPGSKDFGSSGFTVMSMVKHKCCLEFWCKRLHLHQMSSLVGDLFPILSFHCFNETFLCLALFSS